MYTQENWVTCQNDKTLTLNTIFSERRKRTLGVVVCDFRGEEGN